MNKWTRQLRLFWNGLALREKRMLSGVGVLLAGLLTWLILIQPALKKIDYWQAETPKLRAQAEALQVLLQGVAAEFAPPPNGPTFVPTPMKMPPSSAMARAADEKLASCGREISRPPNCAVPTWIQPSGSGPQ